MAKPVNVSGTSASIAVDVVANIANCTPIVIDRSDAIGISIPNGTSLGTITVYGCLTETGTYQIFRDFYVGVDVSFTATANRVGCLPAPVQGWPRYLKLVCSGTAATITAEGKRQARF